MCFHQNQSEEPDFFVHIEQSFGNQLERELEMEISRENSNEPEIQANLFNNCYDCLESFLSFLFCLETI